MAVWDQSAEFGCRWGEEVRKTEETLEDDRIKHSSAYANSRYYLCTEETIIC